ncbi:NAD(P)-dependent alcohol dehydrogenase [Nonomuraea dietziae]|uniref:NAD(P)-dependent alcohol dehydrogenase n=1 Tax=Nonomuraea dietziae TaxID=65515 RepID=UPI003410F917
MTTMKAIFRDTYCSPDALKLGDIDKPTIGHDDVLIRVHAAGVDQGAWHLITGLPYLLRLAGYGLRTPKTRIPGHDVAGRIEAVGENVTRFHPGDEVLGTCHGSFAEYAGAHHDAIVPKPSTITFEQAAALPASACAALQGLRDKGRLQPGQKVLITGAGGGVGTFAVQLAKAYQAHVTGVCRTTKTELVRSIGADDVIDHTREDFTDRPDRYDLILDTAGNRPLTHLRRALTPTGTLVIVGGAQTGRWTEGAGRQLRAGMLSPFTRQNLTGLMSTPRRQDLQTLTELIETGKLTPIIDRTYPLSQAPQALHHLRSGHASGKITLTV